jgi:5-methylcytosine-specific restriction endonuclease McrA
MDMSNPWRRPTRDHIVPRSKGGTNVKENLLNSCAACNETKNDMRLLEWIEELQKIGDPRADRVARLMAKLPRELL